MEQVMKVDFIKNGVLDHALLDVLIYWEGPVRK